MTFHMEQDANARVKWGGVTVAIGPAEIDAESVPGVVVVAILAKGTRWSVELRASASGSARAQRAAEALRAMLATD